MNLSIHILLSLGLGKKMTNHVLWLNRLHMSVNQGTKKETCKIKLEFFMFNFHWEERELLSCLCCTKLKDEYAVLSSFELSTMFHTLQ